MNRITLTAAGKLFRYDNKRPPSQVKEEIKKLIPVEVTFESEVIFKIVPKTWRNPAFPIH